MEIAFVSIVFQVEITDQYIHSTHKPNKLGMK